MPTLHLRQQTLAANKYRAHIKLTGDAGYATLTADADFSFQLSSQDREDIRWYMEDYIKNPRVDALTRANRIEEQLVEIGHELFDDIFEANRDTRHLWAKLDEKLSDTRIEIITEVEQATTIPWELLRDPQLDVPLALRASAFVRAFHTGRQRAPIPQGASGEAIRILLVICRPRGRADSPFRSVGNQLLRALSEAGQSFQLDVLRPPTYEQLSRVLRLADKNGQPYHVVHFDGHGIYRDLKEPADGAQWPSDLTALSRSKSRMGKQGYLLFENPAQNNNMQPVNGLSLGQLLVETKVFVLLLNACRSAHAEQNAYGSLAQEVMNAGVAGVVAMRYKLYLVTATRFVADLYAALPQGQTLGQAVTFGRKQLDAQPPHETSLGAVSLQDWSVPVVYEAAPIRLFPPVANKLTFTLFPPAHSQASPSQRTRYLDPDLPHAPDVGFFGHDETLLRLDRAFDEQEVLLLHGPQGIGKTMLAAEFGRWYCLTGGVAGPVLFTTFTQETSLPQLLHKLAQRFDDKLKEAGINWSALDGQTRYHIALQLLQQLPLLWIWDQVESLTGALGETESQKLANFLRAARGTKAKFLLTSQQDERAWLADLPQRIRVRAMRMTEPKQLAQAIAKKYGSLTNIADWGPLLRLTKGNPQKLTTLMVQALREKVKSKEEIEAFVAKLKTEEVTVPNKTASRQTPTSSKPPAPKTQTSKFQETARMNTKLRRQLVSALLACDSMSDRHTRDTIVDELPDDIRHTIRRHSADRVDVTNIVKACLNYHEGLEELIEAVRSHEGNSTAMQQLDELMK